MTIPEIDHPTDNVNYTVIFLDNGTIHYSYNTPIAFQRYHNAPLPPTYAIRENDWSSTRDKHLDAAACAYDLDRKQDELPGAAFEQALEEAFE